MDVLAIMGWTLLLLSCAGAAYALVAGILVPRFVAGAPPDTPAHSSGAPAVTILKPLKGIEPGLAEHLATFCRQDYLGAIQVVFGVEDARDPAIQAVAEIERAFPAHDITLVADGRICGVNRKIANLVNMEPAAKNDILIVADSDIAVRPDYVRTIVACLGSEGTGAVTCLYKGIATETLWSRLTAMGIDYHFLPGVVVAIRLGLGSPCFGSTIALRRAVLDQIGGFERFAGHLADDHEIGRAVRRADYRVSVPPMIVAHACAERSLRELIAHELRWARTIRTIDGIGYAGSGMTHALPLALIGAAFLGFQPESLVFVALALAARLWLAVRIDVAVSAGARSRPLFILRDLLSFFVYVAAFFVRSVTWRDRRFHLGPERTIAPVEER
jgi:ceramide glucosyltransferase